MEVFAHEHDLSKGMLSKVINGKVDMRISTLSRIAQALELSLTDLLPPNFATGSLVMESSKSTAYRASTGAKRKKRSSRKPSGSSRKRT